MYGHQRHLVAVLGIILVHIGHQHHPLQPLLDRSPLLLLTFPGPDLGLALLVEELHRVEQLLDIVQRTGRLRGVLGPVSADDTRTGRNFESQVVQPFSARANDSPRTRATNSATLRTMVFCTGSVTGSAVSASTASHIDRYELWPAKRSALRSYRRYPGQGN